MSELTEAGCVAFSQADAPLADTQVLMRALQYAATFGYPVWLRPQDPHLSRNGIAHEGATAGCAGSRRHPGGGERWPSAPSCS
jgi:dihydroorotase